MGSGKVEKILMFSILVVIGLILVVAFRGAQDGELGGTEDGGGISIKKNETANAKEESAGAESDLASRRTDPKTGAERGPNDRGAKEPGAGRPKSEDGARTGNGGPASGTSANGRSAGPLPGPKGEPSLNDILKGLGSGADRAASPEGANPEAANPGAANPGAAKGPERPAENTAPGAADRSAEKNSAALDQNPSQPLDRITLVPTNEIAPSVDKPKVDRTSEKENGTTAGGSDPARIAQNSNAKTPGPATQGNSAGTATKSPGVGREGNGELREKAAASKVKASGFVYTVRPGDSLFSIARNLFGDEHVAVDILALNSNIGNADHIVLGQELRLPDLPFYQRDGVFERTPASSAAPVAANLAVKPSTKDAPKSDARKAPEKEGKKDTSKVDVTATSHTVSKGETLSSIAAKYYGKGDKGGWKRIYDANRDRLASADVVREGTELRIPR